MIEPELWTCQRGSSESDYRWMVFTDIRNLHWFTSQTEAQLFYNQAMLDYRAAMQTATHA